MHIFDFDNLDEKVNAEVFLPSFNEQHREIIAKNGKPYVLIAKPGPRSLHQKFRDPSRLFSIEAYPKVKDQVSKYRVGLVNFVNHGDHVEAEDVHVDPKHRRKGLAKAMYQFAKDVVGDIKPSSKQTSMGKQMWSGFSGDKSLNEASAKSVLDYVKSQHHDFRLDDAILGHKSWQLVQMPLSKLRIPDPESGEDELDPYDRVQWMDMSHVDEITPQDIKRRPIVADNEGNIIDGNHRALAARLMGMPTIPTWVPINMTDKEQSLQERVSSVLFHYTNIYAAMKILESGEFQLSSSLGTDVESQYAPKGYPYFLSATRTRTGGYHDIIGDTAVMFVLDGDWFNQRYPGKSVDYWGNRDPLQSYHRAHEAEDRIFSQEPSIPINGVRAVHVLVKRDSDENRKAWGRKVLIAAKKRNIPVYLYDEKETWRSLDSSRAVSSDYLKGQDPAAGRGTRGHRGYLMPWMELLQAQNKSQLSKRADSIRYGLAYTYDKAESVRGLSTDLSNARKPDAGPDREHAVKIINFMRRNGLSTIKDLVDFLAKKWEPKKQAVGENFADGKKPGRKGLSKRMGVPTKASVSKLRKIAKSSSGEKQRMAHWLANMKAGKKKMTKESKQQPDLPQLLKQFFPIAMKVLKLDHLPKIELEKHIEAHDGQATFGRFVNGEKTIYLAIMNRHPIDILRTLAHELAHYKQLVDNRLDADSGRTGSPEENEAHVKAGIIMRLFNKKYPETLNLAPITAKSK